LKLYAVALGTMREAEATNSQSHGIADARPSRTHGITIDNPQFHLLTERVRDSFSGCDDRSFLKDRVKMFFQAKKQNFLHYLLNGLRKLFLGMMIGFF
jgi:hypothetical protein